MRRWPVVLAATIVVGLAVFAYRSTVDDVYQSTAVLQLKLPESIVDDGTTTEFRTQSLAELATASPVLLDAAEEAEVEGSYQEIAGRVTLGLRDTPGFLEVTATASNPAEAARLAQALADRLVLETSTPDSGVTTEVVGQASIPDAPIAPHPTQEAVLAALISALVAGESIVVVRKLRGLFSPVDTAPELERTMVVPTVDTRRDSSSEGRLLPFFASHLSDMKVITVIQLGDDATTVPAALVANTAAGLKRRVLLVDLELFDPELQDTFGRTVRPELADVLNGRQSLDEVVRPAADTPNVQVLNARAYQSDLVGLIRDASFKRLIASSSFDYAVLSIPARGSVVNALLAARRFGDAVAVAFDPDKTGKSTVRSMVAGVGAVGAHLAAILLYSEREAAGKVSSLDVARARLPLGR